MGLLATSLPLYPLVALTVILVASVAMFVWNVRRSTDQRVELELEQWAHNNRLSLHPAVPGVVREILPEIQFNRALGDGDRTLVLGHGPWGTAHLLVTRLPTDWPPTALRPTHGEPRPIDALPLKAYPTLPGTERFLTAGTTLHPARLLADSHVRALLPPDLALLLHGPHLVLDFSTRPFDTLEFSRLLPLADQLLGNLPRLA